MTIVQSKTVRYEREGYSMICVAAVGDVDDWTAYTAREDAVLKQDCIRLGTVQVNEWVMFNGLKMHAEDAAFVFPVMNAKRYRR